MNAVTVVMARQITLSLSLSLARRRSLCLFNMFDYLFVFVFVFLLVGVLFVYLCACVSMFMSADCVVARVSGTVSGEGGVVALIYPEPWNASLVICVYG